MSLLSTCGGMGRHMYIAQVSLWRSCEGSLHMIWIEWVMTKVVVNERVLIWGYEVCVLCLVINEGVMNCWVCYV